MLLLMVIITLTAIRDMLAQSCRWKLRGYHELFRNSRSKATNHGYDRQPHSPFNSSDLIFLEDFAYTRSQNGTAQLGSSSRGAYHGQHRKD